VDFTYFYLVLLFLSYFTEFQWILPSLPSFTGFYHILPNFNRFYLVLSSFTGCYRVLLGFTEFYRVLPSFTEFCPATNVHPIYCVVPNLIRFDSMNLVLPNLPNDSSNVLQVWFDFSWTLLHFCVCLLNNPFRTALPICFCSFFLPSFAVSFLCLSKVLPHFSRFASFHRFFPLCSHAVPAFNPNGMAILQRTSTDLFYRNYYLSFTT